MPNARLFHITSRAELEDARATGEYRPQGFAREGFIHCSYLHQVEEVANRIFRGQTGLVLLELKSASLAAPVVEENLEGGQELYPHLYGPLPFHAIAQETELLPDENGHFSFSPASPSQDDK